jgi:hypothetical protein
MPRYLSHIDTENNPDTDIDVHDDDDADADAADDMTHVQHIDRISRVKLPLSTRVRFQPS